MKNAIDAKFEPESVSSFPQERIGPQRKRILDGFLDFSKGNSNGSVLKLFVARPGYVLMWEDTQGFQKSVSGRLDARRAASLFRWNQDLPGTDRQAAGGVLPFPDAAFDWIFCDAVIEHIGPFERQHLLLSELFRISRNGVFVTTTNRWHPWEFDTSLPLLHWLPAAWWNRILRWMGKGEQADESERNLLGSDELKKLASLLPGHPEYDIAHVRFLGMKKYFFLQIVKNTFIDPLQAPLAKGSISK